jgi:hypothetical protein
LGAWKEKLSTKYCIFASQIKSLININKISMSRQAPEENSKNKPYKEPEISAMVVKEPEVAYGTKPDVSFDEDFNRGLAMAITMDELRQHLYQVIDAWPWKEK